MDCGCTIEDIPENFLESEHHPDIIRVDFGVTGSRYGLVIDRDIPFTLTGYFRYDEETATYTLESEQWSTVTLSIDGDTDKDTDPLASFDFSVIDQGVTDPDYVPGSGPDIKPDIDSSERWQGVFPASELNKVALKDWVIATLKSDTDELISRCIFKVLGA